MLRRDREVVLRTRLANAGGLIRAVCMESRKLRSPTSVRSESQRHADRRPASASNANSHARVVPILAMVTGAIVHAAPLGPDQLGAMACSGSALVLALSRK